MQVTIDEGTIHLMAAAYRMGKGDPKAQPPIDFLSRCVRLIEADTEQEARDALADPTHRTAPEGESE